MTEDGDQVEAFGISDMVGKWQDLAGIENVDLYNRGVTLYNENQFVLLPGAKGTAIMASSDTLDSVARVFVYPSGGLTEVEVAKA